MKTRTILSVNRWQQYNDTQSIKPENMKRTIIVITAFMLIFNIVFSQGINKLKQYSHYQNDMEYSIPKYTYQDFNTIDLVDFRKKHKLDSITGNGEEITQILKLMRWVHKTVKHDGYKSIPDKIDSDGLIELCKRENRGIHCGGIASVMNEVFLAMGFKSKWITCMPFEQEYNDCHTINIVYSNTLDKWIWIDAMYQTYMMDEKDNLLSIQEVRDRLINSKTVIVCNEYNLNSTTATDYGADDYLNNYMGKNLFRFCAVTDSKAYEDYSQWTIINLYPEGYNPKNVDFGKIIETDIFKEIYIDNSEQFWKNPE